MSPEQLENHAKALTGHPITWPRATRILLPGRTESSRFKRLFRQACRLADAGRKLIERPEVARALEQELLHAIIHCLAANEADDNPKTRHHHAALMVRFEETLRKRDGQRLSLPALCAEIRVPERTLRMCCAEFLMPKAPRQRPSLPPPNWANPTVRANSGLDKSWGARLPSFE